MDQGTEKKVVILKKVNKMKTMLIVTHRKLNLLWLTRALENGQIVADQTPEQLGIKRRVIDVELNLKNFQRKWPEKKKYLSILLLSIVTLVAILVWAS